MSSDRRKFTITININENIRDYLKDYHNFDLTKINIRIRNGSGGPWGPHTVIWQDIDVPNDVTTLTEDLDVPSRYNNLVDVTTTRYTLRFVSKNNDNTSLTVEKAFNENSLRIHKYVTGTYEIFESGAYPEITIT